ncbi:MAG: hypothetical protein DI543_00060 [Bradyrhizobium icense]|jgi:hypothetical protein|nr:MAG: hypothetical protein DI543_00060 [Bradyrhizobium icense]
MNSRAILTAAFAGVFAAAVVNGPAVAHDGRNAALVGGLIAGALIGAAGAAAAESAPPPRYYYGGPPPGYYRYRHYPPAYYQPPPPACGYYPYPPCY